MPIVWVMPDGSVQITRIEPAVLERERQPRESTESVVQRLAGRIQAKTPNLAGGIPSLVTEANVATDRAQRHKWRLRGDTVVVDPAVPDPPDPKKGKKDAIDGATTLAQLKQVLKDIL